MRYVQRTKWSSFIFAWEHRSSASDKRMRKFSGTKGSLQQMKEMCRVSEIWRTRWNLNCRELSLRDWRSKSPYRSSGKNLVQTRSSWKSGKTRSKTWQETSKVSRHRLKQCSRAIHRLWEKMTLSSQRSTIMWDQVFRWRVSSNLEKHRYHHLSPTFIGCQPLLRWRDRDQTESKKTTEGR